ncbi:hypothetical protein JZ751_025901 [Albula glossodonta]|uniref:Uncharacterized protein n=1 Tax=Albula glossodonta TaxID=121402 RepID=A0A8T2NED2_9TELE|nr:hypothetical protein JZ751_025901 [Albula glossodonta]
MGHSTWISWVACALRSNTVFEQLRQIKAAARVGGKRETCETGAGRLTPRSCLRSDRPPSHRILTVLLLRKLIPATSVLSDNTINPRDSCAAREGSAMRQLR